MTLPVALPWALFDRGRPPWVEPGAPPEHAGEALLADVAYEQDLWLDEHPLPRRSRIVGALSRIGTPVEDLEPEAVRRALAALRTASTSLAPS